MLVYEAVDKFADYIDDSKEGSWLEKGLVLDAPPEAIKQFEEYKAMMLEAEKMGIDI